ncbi:GA-binding protein subunit beta-2, partial [Ophiophagus hannah]
MTPPQSSSEALRENEIIPGMSGITDPELPAEEAWAGESFQASEEERERMQSMQSREPETPSSGKVESLGQSGIPLGMVSTMYPAGGGGRPGMRRRTSACPERPI